MHQAHKIIVSLTGRSHKYVTHLLACETHLSATYKKELVCVKMYQKAQRESGLD